ncbi:MAG: YihA family ribosome biogenesis GTP-binding protein [Clostridia bacterium]|nr:YihA family ribosome biogenesis GTP-binding protein [Clostridia bacterium]
MDEFRIKKASFFTSVGLNGSYPEKRPGEIAMVGRSNVGKSSLINCLCRNGKLARISAAPGKTRLVNYYLINDSFYLVDLPGYGFAQRSKQEQQSWGQLMEQYLTSGRVDHLFLLLDIRHEPTAEDRQMFQFLLYYGIPYTIIATKSDKVSKANRQKAANQNAKLVGAPPWGLPFSAETGEGREELTGRIGRIVEEKQKSAGEIEPEPLTE